MWGVARSLSFAKGGAESALGEAGRKSEDALRHAGDAVKAAEVLLQDSVFGGWFGTPGAAAGAPELFSREPVPPALPTGDAAKAPANEKDAQVPPPAAPPAAQARAKSNDDVAMQRHFAALERLVHMGLSPQAARVAMRHLDAWIVAEAGALEMGAAEAAAQAAGQAVLRLGDRVRLEGMTKRRTSNGKLAQIIAYRAEDQRWRVRCDDGEVLMLQPKLLRALEFSRTLLPQRSAAEGGGQTASPGAQELAAAWATLEAKRALWKEQQEAKEIALLEREESVRQLQDSLEAHAQQQQQLLGEQRRSLALDRARALSVDEQHSGQYLPQLPEQGRGGAEVPAADGASPPAGRRGTATFAISDPVPAPRANSLMSIRELGGKAAAALVSEEDDSEEEEEEEARPREEDDDDDDEVWGTDWSALAPGASSSKGDPVVSANVNGHHA